MKVLHLINSLKKGGAEGTYFVYASVIKKNIKIK